MRRPVFLVALLALVVIGSAAELTNFVRSDIAFLLYAAGRLLDGAKLYVDLVEINPPLIIAINVVPVAVSRALGISDALVYRLFTIALLLGSLALSTWVIVRAHLFRDDATRRWLLLFLAAALFVLPGTDFGQREHLMFALLAPYLFVVAARTDDVALPDSPAFLLGALAGIGFALKPHFLLLWVAAEIYGRLRSAPRRFRPWPESIGIAFVLILYGLAIALLTPAYFGLLASVGRAYAGYLHDSMSHVLVTAPGTTIAFLAILTVTALVAQSRHRAMWVVLAIAVATSFVAAAAQQKGWSYHFYPPTAFAFVLLGFVAVDVTRPLPRLAQQLYGAAAVGVVAATALWAGVLDVTRTVGRNPVQEHERAQLRQLEQAVRHYAPNGSLFIFSYTIGSSFPLVNYSGVHWASRFPHLWIIEATYQDQLQAAAPLRYHTWEEMAPAERYLNDAVFEDLSRYRPALIMVLRHARDAQVNGLRRIDYIKYFSRDPRIAGILAGYRFVEDVGQYRLYRRVDMAPSAGPPPQSEPGTEDIIRYDIRGAQALWVDRAFVFQVVVFLVIGLLTLAWDARARRRLDTSAELVLDRRGADAID